MGLEFNLIHSSESNQEGGFCFIFTTLSDNKSGWKHKNIIFFTLSFLSSSLLSFSLVTIEVEQRGSGKDLKHSDVAGYTLGMYKTQTDNYIVE